MADIYAAVRARILAGNVSVVGQRVHPVTRAQNGTLPAILMLVVSSENPQHLDGEDDMHTTRMQVDCLSKTHSEARALSRAVKNALDEPAEIEGISFWNASFDGPRDSGEETTIGFVYRSSIDVILRHTAEMAA